MASKYGTRIRREEIGGVMHKQCNTCDVMQPLDLFNKAARMADGHNNKCKGCTNKKPGQNYRRVQRIEVDGVMHKQCNTCDVMQPLDQYHAAPRNPDGCKNKCKVCTRAQEALRSRDKRTDPTYRAAEVAVQREYQRVRRAAGPSLVNAYQRAWRTANPGKSYGYTQKWEAANPGSSVARTAKRRALKLSATTGDAPDYVVIYAAHDDCYLCRRPLTNPIHMDHVVPLSRGGAHVTSNLLPTHARCNLRKHDALLSELSWYRGPVDIGAAATKGT